ncbi:unnamed protein product [Caenorhabditis bovis]|uniref:Low molecular weight phosphotyrosine protein phosphatase n=1 Tax=Caenorhabditis bovis TaxID=2654633 RepID=A0A8S1F7V2_9PELO|nr:unnamed protein product [Caenorhabditis bovis]
MGERKKIMFVCLGNICRSPIAEAVFIDCLKRRGKLDEWVVDSSAIIGYHTGNSPDQRAMEILKKFGITDYRHRAKVISAQHFKDFDYVFGMDDENLNDLKNVRDKAGSEAKAVLGLLGEYDPEGVREVPDPYYHSGSAMFEKVYHQCVRCCEKFLDSLYC